jgi:hypothetical protein
MNLIDQISEISLKASEKFSGLTESQLNWKPEPAKWSIAQCLDHLIVSNKTYYPSFEKLISHSYRLSFFQKLNPFKKLPGPLMVRSMSSESKKTFKSPKIFEPTSSNISPRIVSDFINHQEEMKKYYQRLGQLDTKNLIMASPVSGFITYTLSDGMQLLAVHEQRHLKQAENVLNHPNFPR